MVGVLYAIYIYHIFITIAQQSELCNYILTMFMKVGIAGDSFVSHLEASVGIESQNNNSSIKENLGVDPDSVMKTWHGVGGRTVTKFLELHLSGIADLNVEAEVIQIVSNDL